MLIVASEPTPYKTDLFNAISTEFGNETTVFYTTQKDWGRDAGHDFRNFPDRAYRFSINNGRTLFDQLQASVQVVAAILRRKPVAVLVCGYTSVPLFTAILTSVVFRVPFFLWADHFNTAIEGKGLRATARLVIREMIRKLVFQTAKGVLTCGKPGMQSALEAGCPPKKLQNFPYVVDADRLRRLAADGTVQASREATAPIILFSGRLIERKGLGLLLSALHQVKQTGGKFHLWVEGDGPLRTSYEEEAQALGLADEVTFWGFRQMDDHAALLSQSDIVVVPSTRDPWGIVVTEGMLFGKAVCAADVVGSAADRIDDGVNGVLFPTGNSNELAAQLSMLLADPQKRMELGRKASETAQEWTPERNATVLREALQA